jgi:hypothetical protein
MKLEHYIVVLALGEVVPLTSEAEEGSPEIEDPSFTSS